MLLTFLFSIVPNWPIVLVFLGVASRLMLAPVQKFTIDQQKRISQLKPRLDALSRAHKSRVSRLNEDDRRAELAGHLRDIHNLKRSHGVRDGWMFLSTLAQLPVFIWLYRSIQSHSLLMHASYAWVPSLLAPDPLFVLPIAAALAAYLSARSQKANPWLQSGMTLAFSAALPSAVVIYSIAGKLTQLGLTWSFHRTV